MLERIKKMFKRVEDIPAKERILTIDVKGLTSTGEHDRFWRILQYMYNEFLKNDPKWHFFYEGDYNHIRCQESFMKKVTKVLDANNIEFTEPKEWEDASAVVLTYNTEFTALFHNFSEIAIKFGEDSADYDDKGVRDGLLLLSDRVLHCFLNHMYYAAEGGYDRDDHLDMEYEIEITSNLLKNRAFYIGKYRGMKIANDSWVKRIEAHNKQ